MPPTASNRIVPDRLDRGAASRYLIESISKHGLRLSRASGDGRAVRVIEVEMSFPWHPPKIGKRLAAALLLVSTVIADASGGELTYLDGHAEPVRDVGVSPDGKTLVSVGDDGRVIVRPTDDLQAQHLFAPREGGLRCLTFSQDGKYVLAAGNLADFSRTTEIDGAVRVSLKELTQDFIELPVRGTVLQMTLIENDLVYFSASKELLTFDIGLQRVTQSADYFGGFTGVTAISPRSRHFAVTSQNEVNRRSAEPCRLTVMEQDGTSTLSYELANALEYRGAQICFTTDERLTLALPGGTLLRWDWAEDSKRWESVGEPLPIPEGPFSAIVSGGDGEIIWLARNRTIIAIDGQTGETRQQTDIATRIRLGSIFATPVECLSVLTEPPLVVGGLSDGRLVLLPIAEQPM